VGGRGIARVVEMVRVRCKCGFVGVRVGRGQFGRMLGLVGVVGGNRVLPWCVGGGIRYFGMR
jgi:hypothetical protein